MTEPEGVGKGKFLAGEESGLRGGKYLNRIKGVAKLQFADNPLNYLVRGETLNHRVPGSSPGAPTTPKALMEQGF